MSSITINKTNHVDASTVLAYVQGGIIILGGWFKITSDKSIGTSLFILSRKNVGTNTFFIAAGDKGTVRTLYIPQNGTDILVNASALSTDSYAILGSYRCI